MKRIDKFELLNKIHGCFKRMFYPIFPLVIVFCILPGAHWYSQFSDQNRVMAKTIVVVVTSDFGLPASDTGHSTFPSPNNLATHGSDKTTHQLDGNGIKAQK